MSERIRKGMSSRLRRVISPFSDKKTRKDQKDESNHKAPGIKFKVASHNANPVVHNSASYPMTRGQMLKEVWSPSGKRASQRIKFKELFQSSLGKDATATFVPKKNGFVYTVIEAYNRHHGIVIRPDDIWIAILSQLNIYVNANAGDLRSFFVAHEGQKELIVRYSGVTRYTMDFSIMARDFAALLKENINDPTLYDTILPSFSTTTLNDTTICSAMMMSIMQAYFIFTCILDCGIPEVTLLGTKKDYESILARLDKIEEMGAEARAFVALLRPIIREFIATFDAVKAGNEPNMDFWGKICHVENFGSGPDYIGGWLAAFCVWNADGKWQGPKAALDASAVPTGKDTKAEANVGIVKQDQSSFDASVYGQVNMDRIPVGFTEVPVNLIDNGLELDCVLVSGHVGARLLDNGVLGSKVFDTLQPEPHWFFFEIEKLG